MSDTVPKVRIRGFLIVSCLVPFMAFFKSFGQDSLVNPVKPLKLVFIHHSCGENWLSDENGGLAAALQKNGYFVSDTNYGWGPDSIGDRTDIVNWPEWFAEANSGTIMKALFNESGTHSPYKRILKDPGGENKIIIFKSCFPNSNIEGGPDDKPSDGKSGDLTVSNAKGIYNRLLQSFAKRQDKLFVVVTAPPVSDTTHAKNARSFNNWLVHDWLKDYKFKNVAVFDFYNVLTAKGAHHRISGGNPEYVIVKSRNTLYYPAGRGDDHPSRQGNRKATEEFIPMLDYYCKTWIASNPPEAPASVKSNNEQMEKGAEGETEVAVSQLPPSPPASVASGEASTSGMIDDFKGDITDWEVFRNDEKAGTNLSFKKTDDGNGMQISFNLPRDSWASCAKVYAKPQDWSRWKKLSVHVEGTGALTIFIYEPAKDGDDLIIFEKTVDLNGRKKGDPPILIPMSEFKQPSWQGDANVRFNAKIAKGVALHFSSEHSVRNGSVLIMELKLVE